MALLFFLASRPLSPLLRSVTRNPVIRHRVRLVRSAVTSETSSQSSSESATDERHGKLGSRIVGSSTEPESSELEPLYDDGDGSESVKDYLDLAKEMIRPDGGPPRWFCPVDCGHPIKNSPVLMFLPGIDGVGLGLILHHKALRVFEIRCLHIPVYDRTPFEGLMKFVEDAVRLEHAISPNRPIYLVGDSFGACLALAVASRNPTIDLILILSNPATSFGKSQLQPLFPVLEALPDELHVTVPYLLSFTMGDPVKMAMASVEKGLLPSQTLEQLSRSLSDLLPRLSGVSDIIPKDTLLWKLKLLKSAASYANSRLHAVKAEVLVLASGEDNMLPNKNEAERLWAALQNCRVRYFSDHGYTLLLENGIHLLTIIKGTNIYRRSGRYNHISDYLPPSVKELTKVFDDNWLFRLATSPVMLSTLEDGTILKGLTGVPNEGPILLVGNHMLMGLELMPLVGEFLQEKKVIVRGIAHPILFSKKAETSLQAFNMIDMLRVFGALPVSPSNFYQLFSTKSFVLLYPGGAREALHRKGEEYKLFWPDRPEFVRMAARFGATIVPFGVVGEDDVAEVILDYNDQMSIPFFRDLIEERNQDVVRLRTDTNGEVANQDLFVPGVVPKLPGRFYYLFGKPIETRGRMGILKDRKNANALYLQIKSEVESILSYLQKKRDEDPYRSILPRTAYQATRGSIDQVPSFEP